MKAIRIKYQRINAIKLRTGELKIKLLKSLLERTMKIGTHEKRSLYDNTLYILSASLV